MLVSGVALGVLAGLAFGGDWRRLARLEILWWPLLAVAIALRVVGLVVPFPLVLYVAALVATGIVAVANRRLQGATLVAAGTALNVLVIVLNGGMPVDGEAARAAGAAQYAGDALHVPLTATTAMGLLADIIPVPLVRSVYSVGDGAIAVGAFVLSFSWVRPR